MAVQFQLNDELAVSLEKLQGCAGNNARIALHFVNERSTAGKLKFEIRHQSTQLKFVTPILHGELSPLQSGTVLEGEFYPQEFGLGFLSLWSMGIAFFASLGITGLLVSSLRAEAQGYVSGSSNLPIVLVVLLVASLGMIWLAGRNQEVDQQYIVEWLTQCFELPPTATTQWINSERSLNIERLLKNGMGVASFGIVVGFLFGMTGDVEDNLPPLKITVADTYMCAVEESLISPMPQQLFSPEQDIYVCGEMNIEKVDQHRLEIPLIFTWRYDGNEKEAMAIEHIYDSAGEFIALLDKPTADIYQPGQYSVSVIRANGRIQLAQLKFTVVEE